MSVGSEVTGQALKLTYVCPFYKVLNGAKDFTHFGMRYTVGVNRDVIPFNPSGECQPGGLYFTTANNLAPWLCYGDHIAIVGVEDDARVFIEKNKFKADAITIQEIIPFNDIPLRDERLASILLFHNCRPPATLEQNYDDCLRAAKKTGALYLVHPRFRTAEMCLAAVREHSFALKFVPEQLKTEELCTIAVKDFPVSLKYVKPESQTRELCLTALRSHWASTEDIVLSYVRANLLDEELCTIAVKQNGLSLMFVPLPIQTAEMCLAAVRENWIAIRFVCDELRTDELLALAKRCKE